MMGAQWPFQLTSLHPPPPQPSTPSPLLTCTRALPPSGTWTTSSTIPPSPYCHAPRSFSTPSRRMDHHRLTAPELVPWTGAMCHQEEGASHCQVPTYQLAGQLAPTSSHLPYFHANLPYFHPQLYSPLMQQAMPPCFQQPPTHPHHTAALIPDSMLPSAAQPPPQRQHAHLAHPHKLPKQPQPQAHPPSVLLPPGTPPDLLPHAPKEGGGHDLTWAMPAGKLVAPDLPPLAAVQRKPRLPRRPRPTIPELPIPLPSQSSPHRLDAPCPYASHLALTMAAAAPAQQPSKALLQAGSSGPSARALATLHDGTPPNTDALPAPSPHLAAHLQAAAAPISGGEWAPHAAVQDACRLPPLLQQPRVLHRAGSWGCHRHGNSMGVP